MSKDKSIKQCILIAEILQTDFQNASPFHSLGLTSTFDLTLNWLWENGIHEIFIYFSKSKDKIEQYLEKIEKYNKGKIVPIFIHQEQLRNLGDVMKDMFLRGLVSEDFLIMYSDTITNINLQEVIKAHFKMKTELQNVSMTSVVREGGLSGNGKMHILSREKGQILQMETDNGQGFIVNRERVKLGKMNVEFRRDITHCDIYICSVDVLKSFREFQHFSMFDYINGMLTSEVYEQKIMAYILKRGQLAYRTDTSINYYLAYLNLICKHFTPFTIFNKDYMPRWVQNKQIPYSSLLFNKILSLSCSVAPTTKISDNCLIGVKSQVGQNCIIEKSIIMDNCVIQDDVVVKNCLVLDNCNLKKGSRFENCLIQIVNDCQGVKSFPRNEKQIEIVNEPLFEESSEQEQSKFQEELENLMIDTPDIRIINQLKAVMKHYNRSLEEFTREMIRTANPQGLKGAQKLTQTWGQILVKFHNSQKLTIKSLLFACKEIERYENAFHIFLQYFFKSDLIQKENILEWYETQKSNNSNSATFLKCQQFIEMLKDYESEEEQDDDEDKNSSQNSI